jgi:hypothetical protein
LLIVELDRGILRDNFLHAMKAILIEAIISPGRKANDGGTASRDRPAAIADIGTLEDNAAPAPSAAAPQELLPLH